MKKTVRKVVLLLDVGNSTIVFALHDGERLLPSVTFPYDEKTDLRALFSLIDQELKKADVGLLHASYVGSVVPRLDAFLRENIRARYGSEPLFYAPSSKKGLPYRVLDPDKVGADLAADLVAARERYGAPCLIIDLGTITKYLLLDETGAFSGCLFLPGIASSLKIMGAAAELLPSLSKNDLPSGELTFGTETISALRNGVSLGIIGATKEIIRLAKKTSSDLKIILTGGQHERLLEVFPSSISDPRLTIRGLYLLYQLQCSDGDRSNANCRNGEPR